MWEHFKYYQQLIQTVESVPQHLHQREPGDIKTH